MNSLRPRLATIGISKNYSFQRLLYNPSAEVLLAEVAAGQRHRIFKRHKDARSYEMVDKPRVAVSCCSLVSCSSAPLAYFSVFKMVGTGRSRGANWIGIKRLECVSGRTSTVVKRGQLKLPKPYESGWVAEIVNGWPDGTGLDCVVAMRAANATHLAYHLCRLNLANRRVQPITELSAFVF